jgi:general secretion pathway protein D
MTSRSARLCLAVLSSALFIDAYAQAPAPGGQLPQNPATPGANAASEELVRLKLPDADIDTVLTALEIYTGKIILRPQQLQTATYNLVIEKPIPKSQAIRAIETVLALNNIGITPLDDVFLKVVNLTNVRTEAPEMISGSALELPPSGKAASKLFQLEFARAQEVQPMLQQILNPFYGGPILLVNSNALLITDSISNLQRVERLLQQIDKPVTAGMKPKFYLLTHAKASDLVNKLRTILTGTLQQQLGSATTYNADDRTNQIVLVTDPRQHEFFDDLIARLDQKADPNTRNDVIYLKHAKASDVVTVLSRIISGQTTAIQRQSAGSVRPGQGGLQPQQSQPPTPGAPPQPQQPNIISASSSGNPADGLQSDMNEFSALMTVVNDDRSNSVVVSGTANDLRMVNELIEKLDIVLAQVRIEVVIAEVTLSDQHSSGISALGLRLEGDKLVGFALTEGNPANLTVEDGVITRPGSTGRFDLAATISMSATPRKSNNTIMSVPAIVTSHGKQAKIFNGETRPVVTGSVISGTVGGSTSTVTQQQIGTNLTVTPFIGIDGSVQLDIVQAVEDVIGTVPVDGNTQYIIGKRETTSYVTAKSGEIIVLGGFQKTTDAKSSSRIGPIPILGDIFGARRKEKSRQELIFFLRPTVLSNDPVIDNAEAMNRLERLPTRDEILRQLDPKFQVPKSPSVLDKILPN